VADVRSGYFSATVVEFRVIFAICCFLTGVVVSPPAFASHTDEFLEYQRHYHDDVIDFFFDRSATGEVLEERAEELARLMSGKLSSWRFFYDRTMVDLYANARIASREREDYRDFRWRLEILVDAFNKKDEENEARREAGRKFWIITGGSTGAVLGIGIAGLWLWKKGQLGMNRDTLIGGAVGPTAGTVCLSLVSVVGLNHWGPSPVIPQTPEQVQAGIRDDRVPDHLSGLAERVREQKSESRR